MINLYKINEKSIHIEHRSVIKPSFSSYERANELLYTIVFEYEGGCLKEIHISINKPSYVNSVHSFIKDCRSVTDLKYSRMINLLKAYDFEEITT